MTTRFLALDTLDLCSFLTLVLPILYLISRAAEAGRGLAVVILIPERGSRVRKLANKIYRSVNSGNFIQIRKDSVGGKNVEVSNTYGSTISSTADGYNI